MTFNWLFLRSAHPKGNERFGPAPSACLDDNDDMWSHLFATLVRRARVKGTILREGTPYNVGVAPDLADVRVPALKLFRGKYNLILNRGGYSQYREVIKQNSAAFHVYVGCGERYNPRRVGWLAGCRIDLAIVDSPAQEAELGRSGLPAVTFTKPAAPLFKPVAVEKDFDFVWVCRNPREFKGGKWLAERIPPGTRLLHIGLPDTHLQARAATGRFVYRTTGLLSRRQVPAWACRACVGLVCDDGLHDSGPRILPEYLAMGIPVLVRRGVRANLGVYVNNFTGAIVEKSLAQSYKELMARKEFLNPAGEYDSKMSLDCTAKFLLSKIKTRICGNG